MALIGNKNACKENRMWGDELRKVIAQDKRVKLRKAIEAQLDAAAAGDIQAQKEIADRLDGRPKQQQEITGANGGALAVSVIERRIIGQKAGN